MSDTVSDFNPISGPTCHLLNDDRTRLIRMMLDSPIPNENAAVVLAVCELLMQGQRENQFKHVLPHIAALGDRVGSLLKEGVDEMETLSGQVNVLIDAVLELGDRVKSLETHRKKATTKL